MYNRVECIGVFAKSQKNKNKIKTMIRVRFRHCGCAALPLYAFGGDQVNGTIDYKFIAKESIYIPISDSEDLVQDYETSNTYSIHVGLSLEDLERWKKGYLSDKLFSGIIRKSEEIKDLYPQYQILRELIYFEDWNGNLRLCVPESLRVEIMSEVHNALMESAHRGYAKTYNWTASTYYWPRMSRDIKRYVSTCDICQTVKPRRHAPLGLLQPIPIPSRPFEVVTMDFIPELPESEGFKNILVIVNKLTKYAIFIPTTVNITEKDTAELFFHHVILKFGIPRQVISDRDVRWRGDFRKEMIGLNIWTLWPYPTIRVHIPPLAILQPTY